MRTKIKNIWITQCIKSLGYQRCLHQVWITFDQDDCKVIPIKEPKWYVSPKRKHVIGVAKDNTVTIKSLAGILFQGRLKHVSEIYSLINLHISE